MGLKDNVKKLIENSGLSIAAAAEKSGVPQPRLNDIVLGKTKNPQLKTLKKLSVYFNVPVDELTGEGPMKNEQSVGDRVQIGDSVEAEVVRGGEVVAEKSPAQKLLDEAYSHLRFIQENDESGFKRMSQVIKAKYIAVLDRLAQ